MSEAHIQPVPTQSRLLDDVRHYWTRFYGNNRVVIGVAGVVVVSAFLNRALLRRELKHMNFAVEVFPSDDWGDYGNAASLGE